MGGDVLLSAGRALIIAGRLQLRDQIAHRLTPRTCVFLAVHADAIGLVPGEALPLRMIDEVLLELRRLADVEHLVAGPPRPVRRVTT
ncbi:MAG: hypothetical protein K0R41_741 [Geminicoccaceae bacterium]|jgi:hypothetical protein|nr:hypothetical protein [Geminicoccaceae bacterium]